MTLSPQHENPFRLLKRILPTSPALMKRESGVKVKSEVHGEFKPIFDREHLPTSEEPDPHPKRKCVSTACQACRKRKSKVRRPSCLLMLV